MNLGKVFFLALVGFAVVMGSVAHAAFLAPPTFSDPLGFSPANLVLSEFHVDGAPDFRYLDDLSYPNRVGDVVTFQGTAYPYGWTITNGWGYAVDNWSFVEISLDRGKTWEMGCLLDWTASFGRPTWVVPVRLPAGIVASALPVIPPGYDPLVKCSVVQFRLVSLIRATKSDTYTVYFMLSESAQAGTRGR